VKKPYAMIAALFLLMSASASAAAATPSSGPSAPVNSIDRSGRAVQSLGSHVSNVGVAVHEKAHRLEVGLQRRLDRADARIDASLARTGAGFRNAGESLKTGVNKLALKVNARWDAARAATGTKLVQAGTKVGHSSAILIKPQPKLYAGRTETIHRPNGARYYVGRIYQADSRGRLHEVARVAAVKHPSAR
jgi:hypothetical protein